MSSVKTQIIRYSALDALTPAMGRMKSAFMDLIKTSKSAQGNFSAMTKSAMVGGGAYLVTKSMASGLKPAVSAAGDLQEELIGVRAELTKVGATKKQIDADMKSVKSTAFAVQAWTPFDEGQIVALENELIKSGAKVSHVVGQQGATAAASALAVYEKLDPVESGKALIGIATPFKMAADQYMKLADSITRTSSASTASAQDIIMSARYAAGTASELGYSVETMLNLTGMLAQHGIKGERGGTTMRSFLGKAAEVEEFRDAKGNMVSIEKMLDIIRTKMDGMGCTSSGQMGQIC